MWNVVEQWRGRVKTFVRSFLNHSFSLMCKISILLEFFKPVITFYHFLTNYSLPTYKYLPKSTSSYPLRPIILKLDDLQSPKEKSIYQVTQSWTVPEYVNSNIILVYFPEWSCNLHQSDNSRLQQKIISIDWRALFLTYWTCPLYLIKLW